MVRRGRADYLTQLRTSQRSTATACEWSTAAAGGELRVEPALAESCCSDSSSSSGDGGGSGERWW